MAVYVFNFQIGNTFTWFKIQDTDMSPSRVSLGTEEAKSIFFTIKNY